MGKYRTKLKSAKGKRWAKHHSCVSNPTTTKYRRAVKFFAPDNSSELSGLTLEAMIKHNMLTSCYKTVVPETVPPTSFSSTALQSDLLPSEDVVSMDTESVNTIDTFASEWSNCTNVSFHRFLHMFQYDCALHKEMLAILAAVTDVIKEHGGKESASEYYFALLTTLDEVLSRTERNTEQLTAILALFNLAVKNISPELLRTQCSEVSDRMLTILNDYVDTEERVLLKFHFSIVASLLQVPEKSIWTQEASSYKLFSVILDHFGTDSRPKWRKMAQHIIAIVVRGQRFNEPRVNPPGDFVANFCLHQIEQFLSSLEETTRNSSMAQNCQTAILHTLNLMKDCIQYFNAVNLKKVCESVLRVLTLNYPVVTLCGFDVLHHLFFSSTESAPSKLTVQLINALYDFQPAINNSQLILAWIAVIQQCHLYLTQIDVSMGWAALPKAFTALIQLWLSEKADVTSGVTQAFESLVTNCVPLVTTDTTLYMVNKTHLEACFQTIFNGLNYQFNRVWNQVLYLISRIYKVGGKCSELLAKSLQTLAELRDSYNFCYNKELEYAVGAAVRSMGPEIVLNAIPITLQNGDINLDRSWLLQVLKENIKVSTLKFFIQNVLPLAVHCFKRSSECASANNGAAAHTNELLYIQLWSLLPSICQNCTDIKDSFKSIAKVLGTALTHRKEIRVPIMSALRRLIMHSTVHEQKGEILGYYAKNYLPILFNIYTTIPMGTDEEGHREVALITIKMYLQIAATELHVELFNRAMERLNTSGIEDPEDVFIRESIQDLLRLLIPYQTCENINTVYEECIKSLPTLKNSKDQKKAYRLLETICACPSESCSEFLCSRKSDVQKLLKHTLNVGGSLIATNGARLRCYHHLLRAQDRFNVGSKLLLQTVLPLVVGCLKDANRKTQQCAADVLKFIGGKLLEVKQLESFVTKISAGLMGDLPTQCCTLLAVTVLFVHFSGDMSLEYIQIMLDNVIILMDTPDRDVMNGCLGFLREYCRKMPPPVVSQSIPAIMKSLLGMTSDCRNHFRLKTRDILDYLLRKYGYATLIEHVPHDDLIMFRRLRNLRKLNERKKQLKQRNEQNDYDIDESIKSMRSSQRSSSYKMDVNHRSVADDLFDDDSDDDESSQTNQNRRYRRMRAISPWISEEPEDDIVDFTDPVSTRKIHTSRLRKKSDDYNEQKDSSVFPVASDGRLIIKIDEDDRKKNKQKELLKIDDDDISTGGDDDDFQSTKFDKRKRKNSSCSSQYGSCSSTASSRNYRTGGSGIHRSTASSAGSMKSSYKKVPGAEYKSKKAKGDVKKAGKPDPYAYLPLDRVNLNRRKKKKLQCQFKGIVRGIRKGAKGASKLRRTKN